MTHSSHMHWTKYYYFITLMDKILFLSIIYIYFNLVHYNVYVYIYDEYTNFMQMIQYKVIGNQIDTGKKKVCLFINLLTDHYIIYIYSILNLVFLPSIMFNSNYYLQLRNVEEIHRNLLLEFVRIIIILTKNNNFDATYFYLIFFLN